MRSKPADSIGVTFVNQLLGRGVLNNVINLTFGVFNFTPDPEVEGEVDPDSVIAARLRMDIPCARQLHANLGDVLAGIDAKVSVPPTPAPVGEGVASGKPH